MANVEFAFDVQCPFAYIASTRIEACVAAANSSATITWTPILLGGLYLLSKEPQGAASASTVMAANKQRVTAHDLRLQARRANVTLNWHPQHPVKSVAAQRLLTACPGAKRAALAHALYRAYWVLNEDLASPSVLERYARAHGVDMAAVGTDANKRALHDNTKRVADRGAFGVPAMFVGDELFWGNDRMALVQHALGAPKVRYPLLRSPSLSPAEPLPTVKFYFDFSSPWSFIGYTQYERFTQGAHVELVPILLGALFKLIGTPNMPLLAMSDAKREYMQRDMQRWTAWWEIEDEFRFPDVFPIRTVTPLRVALVEPRTTRALYTAAWSRNQNIGDEAVLRRVLEDAGFDAGTLLKRAADGDVRARLVANTEAAAVRGVCGVPTFEVGDHLLWGQDRLDVLREILDAPARFATRAAAKL